MSLVCLKKYNSYKSDFCCELIKKTRKSASNFYGFFDWEIRRDGVNSHVIIIIVCEHVCFEVVTINKQVVQLTWGE